MLFFQQFNTSHSTKSLKICYGKHLLNPCKRRFQKNTKKNLKLFLGKPLILWSIEAAISSGIFDEIYVSTDDNEIAELAASNGANVPFLRPEKFSNDFAIDQEVIDHFLEWMKGKKIKAENLCYLYATAPFITKETLIGVKKLLEESGADMAHTITKYNFPVLKALRKDKNGCLKYMWSEFSIVDLKIFLNCFMMQDNVIFLT